MNWATLRFTHNVGTMCRNLLFLFLLISTVFSAQNSLVEYTQLQKTYYQFSENDTRALRFVNRSIDKAKKNQNFRHLTYAYEDALYYSSTGEQKLKYADSAIIFSIKTGDSALISKSYLGKGIVFYFNFKNYKRALHQYLLASSFAANDQDLYLLNKIKYHIGIVKSYLGYYPEAIICFKECNIFFRNNLNPSQNPNLQYNNTRGYLNTIHQLIIINRQLKNWKKADSLLYLTVPYRQLPEFRQEKGYFLKEVGIKSYFRKEYQKSIDTLLIAANIIKEKKEDSPLALTYFYLGSAYLKLQDTGKGIAYLQKVDSLFNQNQSIFPELRAAYELLLKKIDFNTHPENAIYYTSQLLKVDEILTNDFPVLSSRIYREYDTKTLRLEKEKLLKSKKTDDTFRVFSIVITLLLLLILLYFFQKQKRISQNYKKVLLTLQNKPFHEETHSNPQSTVRKHDYSPDIVSSILDKLTEFEHENKFIEKNLTIRSLASKLNTNGSHLSYVINEHKHMNFNSYLKVLRISYITELLYHDKKYLKYTIEALAECCGIKSRQQFSNQFYEINGIRPTDFINQRKEELKQS